VRQRTRQFDLTLTRTGMSGEAGRMWMGTRSCRLRAASYPQACQEYMSSLSRSSCFIPGAANTISDKYFYVLPNRMTFESITRCGFPLYRQNPRLHRCLRVYSSDLVNLIILVVLVEEPTLHIASCAVFSQSNQPALETRGRIQHWMGG
jgi:hypothetical protein